MPRLYFDGLKEIPPHLLTEEALTQKDKTGFTVLHLAAKWVTLDSISPFLTKNALNHVNFDLNTVWHIAALCKTLKDIPKHLFIEEGLNIKDFSGRTVWLSAANAGNLKMIPKRLFKTDFSDLLLTESDKEYAKNALAMPARLAEFVETHNLRKEVEFRDERLKIEDVDNHITFSFDGLEELIYLNEQGCVFNCKQYKSLAHVVNFIESTYPDIEQTLVLPAHKSSSLDDFVL